MIAFLPPTAMPQQGLPYVVVSSTATVTFTEPHSTAGNGSVDFVYWAAEPELTEAEKAIAAIRARLAQFRLWDRLAVAEQARAARRVRQRAPLEPHLDSFAGRTCSTASRWMVLQ